jgi:hypothetical protein
VPGPLLRFRVCGTGAARHFVSALTAVCKSKQEGLTNTPGLSMSMERPETQRGTAVNYRRETCVSSTKMLSASAKAPAAPDEDPAGEMQINGADHLSVSFNLPH